MVSVRMLISVCTRIHEMRRRKPTRARVNMLKRSKARPSSAMIGSAMNIMVVATTSSSTSVSACIIPFWMNMRVPSRSIIPRVMRSPEWMLSWKWNDSRCRRWK